MVFVKLLSISELWFPLLENSGQWQPQSLRVIRRIKYYIAWHESSKYASYLISIASVLSLLTTVTRVWDSIITHNGVHSTSVSFPLHDPKPSLPRGIIASHCWTQAGHGFDFSTGILAQYLVAHPLFSASKMQLEYTVYIHDTNILSISKGISRYLKINSSKYPTILHCLGRTRTCAIYITASYLDVSSNYF